MSTVLFVDTNFFLQLKEMAALPWADISGDKELVVMVPRTVQGEIDRLKQDGSGRRSKRARRASSFLRQVIHSENGALVVRESNPRVLLSFPPPTNPGKPRPSTLDPSRADDQIVGEVLDYGSAHPTQEVFLLTNDTGPMLTARYHKVRYIEVPDNWLLEPEPDDRDKTIQELKRRLDTLEEGHPVVEISAWIQDDQPITTMEVGIPSFEPLPERTIDQIVDEILDRCPMAEEFGLSGTELLYQQTAAVGLGLRRRYERPTEDEIRQYREVAYPEWLKSIREFLVEFPRRLNQPLHSTAIQLQLRNTGTVPAINALFEIKGAGAALIQVPEKSRTEEPDISANLRIPRPPEPPAGRFSEAHSGFSANSYFDLYRNTLRGTEVILPQHRFNAPERDRNAFYWAVKPHGPTEFLSLSCDEFRHQKDPEHFDIFVVLPRSATNNGAVTCEFSAANLPVPSKLAVPVKTLSEKADTESYARRLVLELPQGKRTGPIMVQKFES